MSTISDKVLDKIKKDHIKPKSKWQFQLRDSGQWFGFISLAFLTTVFFGLLWYFWSDGPWIHGGHFGLFFSRMPLILLSLFLVMGALALFDFRNTGKGYRYSFTRIGLIFLLLAVVLGWSIYYFGMSARMDKVFGNLPYYQDRESYMKEVWQNPQNGLVAGDIVEVLNDKSFVLRDFSNKLWQVQAAGAVWRHSLSPEVGLQIKLIGKAEENVFVAREVRPWIGPGNCAVMESSNSCEMMTK